MIYKMINQKKRKELNGPSAAVIRYDEREDAPTIVAHGKGSLASKIVSMAKENNIPLQEDPMLVENLIDMDLGENIPPQLYAVIAEILLMIEAIGLITITRVKVTPDLSLARVYWTMMGDADQRKKTAKALARASSYVRHLLSARVSLRRSPEVQFLFDQSVAAQDRVEQILQELKQEEAARAAALAPAPPDAADTPDAQASARQESRASLGDDGD